jgi:hypothetical protein
MRSDVQEQYGGAPIAQSFTAVAAMLDVEVVVDQA